jgi:class 3 adenylate cyclase
MACPRCGSEIRAGQKFCAECGLALSASCPNCGAAYEGEPKFCAECGFALAGGGASPRVVAQPEAISAERRFVSILFADLVGFTALSEQADPEEVRDLLSRYFDVARQVIDGHGGAVEKFIGDAVMAVWGAPVAREDDAERAVRAALELVSRVRGIEFGGGPVALRAAVLSGEAAVVPGRVGEGMVAGDLVNTASRLQSVAGAGMVLVGDSTYQATSPAIAYEPAGDQVLKGKQAPVPSWRALRVVARRGGDGRDEGLEPPFVGRDEDLRLLKDQCQAAEREGKLRMVAISGQAGIGKSRLIWELEKHLDGLADQTYYWHQGRSPAYGEGIAFWALGEMVRVRAGIAEGEPEESTRAKLDKALATYVPDSQERRWLAPALGALLGIDEADWAAREQLFSAWRTFFERIADQGPTVMAFEDLQWADAGLLDFIEHMLEWARDKPILIVCLARPELLERRPNFGLGHRALVAIHLEPLPDEAMRDLVRGLFPAIADSELAKIVERAEGVPLYAVETIRALVDAGYCVRDGDTCQLVGTLPPLDVPPTLRALISSRLDTLGPDDRTLLQDAAVIGKAFPLDALAAIAGRPADDVERRLRDLARKEFLALEGDPRSPERGQFGFRQSLIREIAYGTLSKRERRVRHLAVARYYDTLGDDELAGAVATHYLEAYRAAPSGEEGAAVAAQARVALRAAAERATRLHSPAQALDNLEQAMAVTFDDRELADLGQRAAFAAYATGDLVRAAALLRPSIEWHRGVGDLEKAAELTSHLGSWAFEESRIDEGMQLLSDTLAAVPDKTGRAAMYLNAQLARGHLFRGEGELALAAVSTSLEAAQRLKLREDAVQLIITKSWALGVVGQSSESIALLYGAIQMADDEEAVYARTRARYNLSSFLQGDDPRRSLALAKEGIAIARQFGFARVVANIAGNAANAALIIGEFDEVLRLEADIPDNVGSLANFVHGFAGVVHAFRGDLDSARERMAVVEAAVADSSSAQDLSALRYQQAMIAFATGQLKDARRLARESQEAYLAGGLSAVVAGHATLLSASLEDLERDLEASEQPTERWASWSWRALDAGRLALAGRLDESLALYRQVIDYWRSQDLRFDLALTLFERARLLGAVDSHAAAGREEAQAIFAAMGADKFITRLEAAAGPASGLPAERLAPAQSVDVAAARR